MDTNGHEFRLCRRRAMVGRFTPCAPRTDVPLFADCTLYRIGCFNSERCRSAVHDSMIWNGIAAFWRNVVLIALAHVALIAGLIRWSVAAKASSNPESIVWLGGAGDLSADESEKQESPTPKQPPLRPNPASRNRMKPQPKSLSQQPRRVKSNCQRLLRNRRQQQHRRSRVPLLH